MPNSENVTTKFKVDISDLKKNIAEANRQLKTAQAEFKNATAGMQKGEKTVDSLSAQIKAQEKVVESEKAKLNALKAELERYNANVTKGSQVIADLTAKHEQAAREYGENSDEAKKYAKQLDEAQKAQERNKTAIENLNVQIINQDTRMKNAQGAADGLRRELDSLQGEESETTSETDRLNNELDEFDGESQRVTNGGLNAFTVALGNLASKVISDVIGKSKQLIEETVNIGSTYESTVSKLAATMGKTVDDEAITELSDKAKEMGANTQFSAKEAADGLIILAQAGLSAEEQLESIDKVMNLSAAGELGLASSAKYATGAVLGFGDEMGNMRKYTDLMAKGATLANTDVNDLGTALSESAANANNFGQEANSVTLSLLRLAQQGVVGGSAATSLSRAMADVYTATPAAKKALDELGVSAYDSAGKERDFNDVVADLNDKLKDLSAEEANTYKNTIFTTNGLNAFNKMSATSAEKLQEFTDGLAHASDGEGAAAEQAHTMIDNLSGDVTLLNSQIEGVQNRIYEKLAPYLRDGIAKFSEFIEKVEPKLQKEVDFITDKVAPKIESFISFVETHGDTIISVIAGIGAAFVTYKIVGTLQAVFTTLSSIIALIKAGGILSLISNPLGLALAAVAALVIGLTTLYAKSEEFRNDVNLTFNVIKNVFSTFKDMFEEGVAFMTMFWINKIDDMKKKYENIKTTIKQGAEYIPQYFKQKFSEAYQNVKNVFSGVGTFFGNIWNTIKQQFTSIGTKVGQAIGGAFKSAINSVLATVENAINFIPNQINNALDLINKLPNVNIPFMPSVALPRLMAKGGIVTRATSAIVGEGGQNEAVIPLKTGIPQIAAALANELRAQTTPSVQPVTNNYYFNQTNNSPKALSRWDIYRQTRNQLNFAKGF